MGGSGQRWLYLGVAAVLVGAIGTCLACGPSPVVNDAGRVDAGRVDAGRPDAAGPEDAGRPDGGPEDPELLPLPGQPEGCNVLVARHPERLGPLAWQPCLDARPGCEELVVDWRDPRESRPLRSFIESYRPPGPPRIVFIRSYVEFSETLVIEPDGTVLFAARYEQSSHACAVANVGLSDDRMAYHIFLPERFAPLRVALTEASMPDGRNGTWWMAGEEEIGPRFIQMVSLRPGLIAVELAPGGVATIRSNDLRVLETGGRAYDPVIVGDLVLFSAQPDRYENVYAETADRRVIPFIAPPDADSFNLRSTGEHLVWFEGSNHVDSNTWATRRIMSAPVVSDPALLEPRALYEYPVPGNMPWVDVGGDWAVVSSLEVPYGHLLVRISTGETHRLDPPPDHQFWRPLYVTDEEIALPVHQRGVSAQLTIFKIALPPP